jgi:predicted nucleotidyltransferase
MVEQDFKEFLQLLNENKVEYCIVGAYAVGLYAEPRYTKDMDILINPTLENGTKITQALKDFGFESMGLTAEDFVEKNKFIQLGYPPVRIDIITSIKGCTFEEIWRNKKTDYYDNVRVFVIGLKDLIKAKKAANRPNDKADVAALLKFNKKKKKG